MRTKSNIFSILILGPVFIIPTLVVFLLVSSFQTEERHFKKSLQTLEMTIIEKNKKRILEKVNSTSDLISYEKSLIEQELHERIKQRVDDAKKIALNLYTQYHTSLSQQQLKRIIVDAIRPLVWNNGESFIWILDFNGVFYLAPDYLRHLEGHSIIDFKDATGREIIKEEIALCRSTGEGFLWDTFTKPEQDPNRQYEQLAYVTAFGHYDWYFGSGEYLDTAIKKTDRMLLKKISTISSQNNEHIFIMNHQGDILLHPLDPSLEGQNIHVSKHPHLAEFLPLFKALLKEKREEFISYEWQHPVSKEFEQKISYLKPTADTDWLIGAGFFKSDVSELIETEKKRLAIIKHKSRKEMLFFGLLLVLISLIVSLIISRWIRKQFIIYEDRIQTSTTALKKLNESLEDKVKERTLELEEANVLLEKLATIDGLTQVYNRYFFMQKIQEEVKRFYRYHSTFSLIMFDLDYFKHINDSYGHQKGDEILVTISRLIANTLRETDTLFRFGGEEFMVILPETALDKAYEIADRMRRLVEENDFGLESPTTISMGVVEFQDGDSVDSIISKADTLLYHSKDEGRNNISKMADKEL